MRRIHAMRLLKELPQVDGMITRGELTLSHLSSAAQAFKKVEHSETQKFELLQSLVGKSQRESERVLVSLVPEMKRVERIKHVTQTQVEFRVLISEEVLRKLEQIKELSSNKVSGWNEVLEWMANTTLKSLEHKSSRRTAPPAPEVKRSGI